MGWTISVAERTGVHPSGGGIEVPLRPKERALLAALALHHPHAVMMDDIAQLVWGDIPPATYAKALHNHVSRLRKVAHGLVVTTDVGYGLGDDVDIARERSAVGGFAELVDSPALRRILATRDLARRQSTDADLAEDLAQGATASLVTRLAQAVAEVPLSEHRRTLLIRALAQLGERRDALLAASDAAAAFAAVGLDASDAIRDLERRLHDNDPTLRTKSSPAARGSGSGPLPDHIIGLDDQLATVHEHLGSTEGTSTIFVSGPAGIGKTTFAGCVRELAAANGWDTHVTSCSSEPAIPLESMSELLHSVFERHPERLAATGGAALLRSVAPGLALAAPEVDVQVDREAMFDAIVAGLRCGDRPTLLMVEDVHWASLVTNLMIRRLQAAGDDVEQPFVVLCTSRTTEVGAFDHPGLHVVVQSWPGEQVHQYVARFGRDERWTAAAAEWIYLESEGNALHVRELALATVDAAGPASEQFSPPQAVPSGLQSSLGAAVAAVGPTTQAMLGAAAVLGRRFERRDLEPMTVGLDAALAEAQAAGIVDPVDRAGAVLRFRHDLLHQVVLDNMASATRVELHDLAARTLAVDTDDDNRLPQRARHAYEALSIDPDRALWALSAAADRQAERYEFEDAIVSYLLAADVAAGAQVHEAEQCRCRIAAGRLMMAVGDIRAVATLEGAAQAAKTLGDEDMHAYAVLELCRLGPTSGMGSVDERGEAALTDALSVIAAPGPRALVLGARSMLLALSGEAERTRASYLEALDAAEASGDDTVQAEVFGLSVVALNYPGDLEMRESLERRVRDYGEQIGDTEHLWGAAHLRLANQVLRGDPGLRETLGVVCDLADVLRRRSRTWERDVWRSTVALIDGDLDRAEQYAEETLAHTGAVAESRVLSVYGAQLLAIRLNQGRGGELIDALRALAVEQPSMGAWHAVLGRAAIDANDHVTAQRELELVVADEDCSVLKHDPTRSAALCGIGDVAYALGHEMGAERLLRQLDPWAGLWSWSGACTFGPIDAVRAKLLFVVGRTDEAILTGKSVLQQTIDLGAPIHRRRVESLLAEFGG